METIPAKEFLSKVWPKTLLRYETLELRAKHRQEGTVKRQFHTSIDDFLKAAEKFGDGWDIYFGVSTRYKEGGKKQDCFRVRCTWIDLDCEILPRFHNTLQPDIIVKSGKGFHVYWILENPIFVRTGRWTEIEAVNRALCKRYKGDIGSIDVSRILRVPGFNNYKYNPPKLVKAHVPDR